MSRSKVKQRKHAAKRSAYHLNIEYYMTRRGHKRTIEDFRISDDAFYAGRFWEDVAKELIAPKEQKTTNPLRQ